MDNDIDINTIAMSIQAIAKEIARLEGLLQSETLTDGADIQDLILQYENAAEELRVIYIRLQKHTSNYPSYDNLIEEKGG